MRITSLFSLNAIALDVAASNQDEIIDKVVELQSTHNNILDKEAYKKALYAREEEGSTYVDNGITVPHAKSDVVPVWPHCGWAARCSTTPTTTARPTCSSPSQPRRTAARMWICWPG